VSEPLQQFGGSWTNQKLERIREYLIAYHKALQSQPFTLDYMDAYAGTGYNTAKAEPDDLSPLFDDLAATETRQFLDGSARIALQIPRPFDHYIFVERHPERFAELRKLKTDFSALASRINLVNEDANDYMIKWCRSYD
jgi:three-Cys-motif partner protein